MKEPLIHSFISDELPDDHPMRDRGTIHCDCLCRACPYTLDSPNQTGDYAAPSLLHVVNECMRPWIETGKGNFCFPCFFQHMNGMHILENLGDNESVDPESESLWEYWGIPEPGDPGYEEHAAKHYQT